MKIDICRVAAVGVSCSLLLWIAAAGAADENELAERRQDAAEKRFEMAKDGCRRLQGDDRQRCENKAEADYLRELDSIRQQASPGMMGDGPDLDGRPGVPGGTGE